MLFILPTISTGNATYLSSTIEPIAAVTSILANTIFVLAGGFVGMFVISSIVRWYEVYKLRKILKELKERVEDIDRKVNKLVRTR